MRLETGERRILRDVTASLGTIRIGEPSAIGELMPTMQRLMRTEVLVMTSPMEKLEGGLTISRYHATGDVDDKLLFERFSEFFETAPPRYAWYDATRPEPEQRNVALDALDLMRPEELQESKIYKDVLRPTGLHRSRQPRILLCEGASLLAWFGAFHVGQGAREVLGRLKLVAPQLARRLRVERQLERAPRTFAALGACLAQLGSPAFVVGANGAVIETNAAGRAVLDSSPATRRDIGEAIRGRPTRVPVQVTRLAESGANAMWLVVVHEHSIEDRIAAAVADAGDRWELTRRQRAVLAGVVRGLANVTIAAELKVSVRAVEQHVTHILDRAGVDSRAALVAKVLLG
ncbi:MAG: helix-turn-helix transcriptional regulator [Kofleriaceae bacterium]|nr:helix-turn-helix transcriptional regulator [Kofleriaceae bacterium]